MKILVIGAGVIGTTYAWQLQKIGCEITHLVRKNKIENYKNEGIQIRCLDLRKSEGILVEESYHPKFVDDFPENDGYNFIIVSVNSNQLADFLPKLNDKTGSATIVFLQNLRIGDDELIAKSLIQSKYIIAYPFKAGGGRTENVIDTVIFGMSLTNTVLGEVDGTVTERVREFHRLLKTACMNPKIIKDIIPYVRTHYIWGACCVAAYIKAGNYENFKQAKIIKESYLAMREGWEICEKQGINPKKVAPTKYYYLPFFFLIPLTQWIYRQKGMKEMFEGHVHHSPEEMKDMYFYLLELGKQYDVDIRVYKAYQPYIEEYFNRLEKPTLSLDTLNHREIDFRTEPDSSNTGR
jgi:2-dehydropantoate 2-reductase